MIDAPATQRRVHGSVKRLSIGVLAASALLVSGACTHHHPGGPRTTHVTRPPTTAPPAVNEVSFELKNGAIALTGSVKPGRNTVHITNTGTVEHEIVFAKAAGGASLPTLPNGAWDEDAMPAGAIIGEAELEAGASTTKTFTFTPGSWVGVCNVVSGTTSHFKNGMWLDFTVS